MPDYDTRLGTDGVPILGRPRMAPERGRDWALGRGAPHWWAELARTCWDLALAQGAVNPEVAWAQACKETAFGRFGRAMTPEHRNPSGLKITEPGTHTDDDPEVHARFPDWAAGFAAHLDHLALYAGAPGYPRPVTPDPRHFPYLTGKAKTVEMLGGKWAPSPTYGEEVVRLLRELGRFLDVSTQAVAAPTERSTARASGTIVVSERLAG